MFTTFCVCRRRLKTAAAVKCQHTRTAWLGPDPVRDYDKMTERRILFVAAAVVLLLLAVYMMMQELLLLLLWALLLLLWPWSARLEAHFQQLGRKLQTQQLQTSRN